MQKKSKARKTRTTRRSSDEKQKLMLANENEHPDTRKNIIELEFDNEKIAKSNLVGNLMFEEEKRQVKIMLEKKMNVNIYGDDGNWTNKLEKEIIDVRDIKLNDLSEKTVMNILNRNQTIITNNYLGVKRKNDTIGTNTIKRIDNIKIGSKRSTSSSVRRRIKLKSMEELNQSKLNEMNE